MSFVTTLRAILSILLLGLSVVHTVQAKPEHGKKFTNWTVMCEELPRSKQKICNVFQNVTNDKGKVVLQVAMGYSPVSSDVQALVTLPLGVMLQPGIEFKGGKADTIRVPFSLCVQNGCIAIIKMTDAMIQAMKSGSKGSIKFAATKKQIIEIPISLSGFTAAFNSLK
jgi:invasion protein IalB